MKYCPGKYLDSRKCLFFKTDENSEKESGAGFGSYREYHQSSSATMGQASTTEKTLLICDGRCGDKLGRCLASARGKLELKIITEKPINSEVCVIKHLTIYSLLSEAQST